jgi:hypothetical protein
MTKRPTAADRRKLREVLRQLLRDNPEGLTDRQLASRAKIKNGLKSVTHLLESMGDAYIDRWTIGNYMRPWAPVWCVVPVPENCPRPDVQGHTPYRKLTDKEIRQIETRLEKKVTKVSISREFGISRNRIRTIHERLINNRTA